MIKFKSLNQSKQFIKILKKGKLNTKYFTIYFDKNIEKDKRDINKCLNVSFVMKKNVGNSVIRNKIKRKLKSAVQKIVQKGQAIDLDYTYIIFGKTNVYKDKFPLVLTEVNDAFKKIKQTGYWMIKLINYLLIKFIKLYKYLISPLLHSNCRHLPTCSEYFIDCLKLNGPITGSFLGIKRILKCHPIKLLGGSSGFDPAPKIKRKKN